MSYEPQPPIFYVQDFGAKGNSATDDTAAFNAAEAAANASKSPVVIPATANSYPLNGAVTLQGGEQFNENANVELGATVSAAGNSISIRGRHRSLSAYIAQTASMTMFDLNGAPGKTLVLSDMQIDANARAFLLLVGGSLFDSIEIRHCNFVGMNVESAGVTLGNFSNLTIDDCLFDGKGALVATGIALTNPIQFVNITRCRFRGLNSGVSLVPNASTLAFENVTIEKCFFDMMYYSAPIIVGLTGSGATVSYTSTTLVDTAQVFVLNPFGTIGTFNQFGYIRAMPVRATGNISSATRSQLIDNGAGFTTDGIIPGEIVRSGTAQAIITSVQSDHILNLEEWLDITTMEPTATPAGAYTLYGILLGRADSLTGPHTVNLDRQWADLDGNSVTPPAGTLYEIPPTPNYPITSNAAVSRSRVVGNTVLRSATDALSPFGDQWELTGNTIHDGQDYGITIDGTVNVSGIQGGQNSAHDNLITRIGTGGIFWGGQFSACIHHNRIFGWGTRNAGNSSPGGGVSAIELNPAGTNTIVGGVVDHNIIDGAGLPNTYYGISAQDLVNVDLDTNNIANVTQADYNIKGNQTSNVTLRHRNSSIDYSASGPVGVAPGVMSTLYGAGSPLNVVTAGIGSTYQDTVNGVSWIKVTGTDATGWQFISSTP